VDVPPGAPVEFQVLRDNDWNQRSSVGVWNGMVNVRAFLGLLKLGKKQWRVPFG
jgi:hypothetical protein